MGVTYKGKNLTLFKGKTGGKNKGSVDGFYHNDADNNEKFFIKKPEDKIELFTELFAGLMIQEFIDRELVAPRYAASLIKADVIRFEDGSYGLIQPCIQFKELFHLIGTGNADNSDRSPMQEALYGPSHYAQLIKRENQFGLSTALMYSLLFGAHSVHSANIVVIEQANDSQQFARIDWGDAFRNYAHPENNKNILYPYETSGWFNYKKLTKDYFLNYRKIAGLFPAMAEKAVDLEPKFQSVPLVDIVVRALKKIPADFLDDVTKNKLAQYTAIDAFADITFSADGDVTAVAKAMAGVMSARMHQITQLKNLNPEQQLSEDMYASQIAVAVLNLNSDKKSFTEQLASWQILLDANDNCVINLESIELTHLTQGFNYYLSHLATQSDALNVWPPPFNGNIFTPYHNEDNRQAIHGHAFIPYYKESIVFRRLFSLDSVQGTARFAAFEQPMQAYALANPDSTWVNMMYLARAGMTVINIIEVTKKAQLEKMTEVVEENTGRLRAALVEFAAAKQKLEQQFKDLKLNIPFSASNELAFYPIFEYALDAFSGDQLVTLCLEELEHNQPTALLTTILSNTLLWERVDIALQSGAFNGRTDNFERKQARLYGLRQGLEIAHTEEKKYRELYKSATSQLFAIKAKIEKLTEAKEHTKKQIASLSDRISGLNSSNKQLEIHNQALNDARAEAKAETQDQQLKEKRLVVRDLTLSVGQQVNEFERLNSLLQAKDKELSNLQGKLSTDGMVQQELMAELKQLRGDIAIKNDEINSLRKQLDSAAVNKEPETSDIFFHRTLQMAHVEVAVQALDAKVEDLERRKAPLSASTAARDLAKEIRAEIKRYAASDKPENEALVDFKVAIKDHIITAEEELGKHRQKWKYVIANISLAVALVGVGYLIAALVNKGVNGNFTFFSKTNSTEHLENLQAVVVNTKGIAG